MDTGQGTFKTFPTEKLDNTDAIRRYIQSLEAANPNHGGWFREGEIIELRGSRFRVKSIKPTQITLKLLPK